MIDAGVRIVDRLIQLLEVREKNKDKYFNNLIEPLYQDAELIMKDYNALFMELISKLEKSSDALEVIKWIEERRVTYLPLRTKVRAVLRHFSDQRNERASRFEKGIWKLMKGGVSLFEEGRMPDTLDRPGNHTVLDVLYVWSTSPMKTHRSRYIHLVRLQLEYVQRAWEDVAAGYAEIKTSTFS